MTIKVQKSIDVGEIVKKNAYRLRAHGPYRKGGPRLVTVTIPDGIEVCGKKVKNYTLPESTWKSALKTKKGVRNA